MKYRRMFDNKLFTEEEFDKEYRGVFPYARLSEAFERFTLAEIWNHLDEEFRNRIIAYARQDILDNAFYEEEE